MSVYKARPRPRTVTITIWGVFLFGAWNAGRALSLASQLELLLAWEVSLDPRLRLGFALLWMALFWGATVALRMRRPGIHRHLPILMAVYGLFELGLLFFFIRSPIARRAWLMNTLYYLGSFLFVTWTLNRRAAQQYFQEGSAKQT